MVNVTPGDKIGSGVHRETFKVEGRARRIAKLIRAWFTLRLAGMRIRLPGVLLQALSFIRRGTLDINAEECRILQSLPAEIRPYLVKNAVLDSTPDNRSALVVDQLVNYDGTNAQTLKSHGRVANATFWTHWDKLLALCIKHNLYFYDVFSNPSNIMVHKISETEWVPIIIDVKSLNTTNIYLDFVPLLHNSFARARILSDAQKTKNRYA